MDIDNITDIEVLRKAAKACRTQPKKDFSADDDIEYVFRKGFWYFVEQDHLGITIYSDDYRHHACIDYEDAAKYLVRA